MVDKNTPDALGSKRWHQEGTCAGVHGEDHGEDHEEDHVEVEETRVGEEGALPNRNTVLYSNMFI